MKKLFMSLLFAGSALFGQQIKFDEYTLPNGLHVILHQDNSAPVVTTGVMYHVGSKDEQVGKTGFAHFFEHLLFEGTENIKRGEWFKIVSSHGGSNNANTTTDRTYYYETFPSNNLELGLWMESDRLRQPVINQIGVDTQKEVVKEEKRSRLDNQPYGRFSYGEAINPHVFKKHPYRWSVIGSFEDLSNAKLEDFKHFSKTFYVPNNAVLVVAGDFRTDEAKKLIEKYFGVIPKGKDVVKTVVKEDPITKEIRATEYDSNIQIPLLAINYRTADNKSKDAYALEMLSNYLTGGKSSVLYKKYVDEKKEALQIFAFNRQMEDYGIYSIGVLPQGDVPLDKLENDLQQDIEKVQTDLISEEDYQKILNTIENDFVASKSGVQNIAHALADAYMLGGNTNNINEELKIYQSVSREDIRNVAKKYLNKNQRVIVNYLPESKKAAK
ncbi:Predicted Zn-dependent peptidase [Algoriella xinjiangensis]|uniref:Predicted Zn-dependent peptidase n=1 Tax=Algoriella xinjiangensis TaxID=684065 RepID=A0A1I4X0H6_9FLAO|nr:pitrilysin family protein [Algoriella xinjiangensis]SFN19494.1 Predicted Zn-dependent peptidase [Algoriella xinjiangensis]VDH14677.1 Protease 3 precursor [Algoriella xinjiangensis]